MTMTMTLDDTRQFRNTQAELSTDIKTAMERLYYAHMPDHRIASELRLPIAAVVRWRVSRFLQAK